MELREEPLRPTLAPKLGDVTHVSLLLRKGLQLSGCSEEQIGELFAAAQPKLLKLAADLSS